MRSRLITTLARVAFALAASSKGATITTVPIDNPGNLADTRYIESYHPSRVGAVAYSFNIGKTEITNARYTAFLNAVATTFDPYGLYDSGMGSEPGGGIVRTYFSGHYTYAVKGPGLGGTYFYDNRRWRVYAQRSDSRWMAIQRPRSTTLVSA